MGEAEFRISANDATAPGDRQSLAPVFAKANADRLAERRNRAGELL